MLQRSIHRLVAPLRAGARVTIASLLALGLAANAHAAQFKIATQAPAGSLWIKEMQAVGQDLKTRTQGRVELKFYPGGVMGADAAVLRKIKLGALQGGALTSSELALQVPDAQLYSLPFMFRNQAEVDAVRAKLDAKVQQKFLAAGLVAPGVSGGGFAYLLSNTPITTGDHLRAAKVWVPSNDFIAQTTFTSAGVTPVSLGIADVYTSLETGLINTVANTPAGAIYFNWHTKVKSATDLPLIYVTGYLVLRKASFDQLSKADQALVNSAIAEGFKRLDQGNIKDNEAGRAALIKEGVKWQTISDADRQYWYGIGQKATVTLKQQAKLDPALVSELESILASMRK
jgi:TRAP-type transport system periplasmic protein